MAKLSSKYILLAVIILHLIFISFSINNPFQGDEVIFIKAADAITETGKPVFNYNFMNTRDEGTFHPPLYLYLLSIPIKLFGHNPIALRSISIIFNLATIILIYFLSLHILGKENEKWAILASALYALNPLTIQSSIILDIDGGILNFFMLLFVFLFIKQKNSLHLIPSFFLVIWSKFTGALLLLASLFFYFIFSRDYKRIKETSFTIISSILLFLSTFWFFTAFLNLGFLTPFKHNSVFRLLLFFFSEPIIALSRSAWSLKLFIYFAIPFFFLLFLSLSYIFIKDKHYNDKNTLFILIIAILTILFYFFVGLTGWNFPKYFITALPYMSIFTAIMLRKINFKLEKHYLNYVFLIILLSLYFFFFLRDPIIPEISSSASSISLKDSIIPLLTRFFLYIIVPIILSYLALFNLIIKRKTLFIFLFLTFFLSIYLGVIQASANYATHNMYGVSGLEETLSYLKENNITGEQLATYPDIGYYIRYNKYYDITFVYNDPEKLNELVINNQKVKYLVIFEKDIARIGLDSLSSFSLDKKIQDYYVFKRVDKSFINNTNISIT